MESKRLSKIKKCQKRLKKLLNKKLIDIILFGSFVKAGTAKDIDIALIFKEKAQVKEIKEKIKNIFDRKIDIQAIDIEDLYSPIWLTLIKEGFSVKKNRFLYDLYDIKPVALYRYSLKKLTNVQKVQFERGLKKVMGKEGNYITRSVILVPIGIKDEIVEFLKSWNIYYESQEYELLPVLRKEEFI